MCQRIRKYSRRVDVKFTGHVTQWLASYNEEYGQFAGHENATTSKYDMYKL